MRVGEVVDYSVVFAGPWGEFLDSLPDYSVLEYDHELDTPISVAVGDDTYQLPYEEWRDMLSDLDSDRREIDFWRCQ